MFAIRSVRRFLIRRRSRGVLLALVVVTFTYGAILPRTADAAARLSPRDRVALRAAIADQLDAFGRDDAPRAWGHASDAIQRQFGTPDAFLRMVREQYGPVYRARAVAFSDLVLVDGHWVQAIRTTDESGRVWRASFTMQRDHGRWSIAGCRLVSTASITA